MRKLAKHWENFGESQNQENLRTILRETRTIWEKQGNTFR